MYPHNPLLGHPGLPPAPQVQPCASVAALPAGALALLAQHARHTLQSGPARFANLQATVFSGLAGILHFLLRTEDKVAAGLAMLVTPSRFLHRAQAMGMATTACSNRPSQTMPMLRNCVCFSGPHGSTRAASAC